MREAGHLPACAQNDGLHGCFIHQALHSIPEVCVKSAHIQAVLLVGVHHKVVYLPEVVLTLKYKGVKAAYGTADLVCPGSVPYSQVSKVSSSD